ncbi:MAG: deoxynucleoside kinase [Bacteroidaceae bacterium]|nr:deoxynucleoside kinase [Bacteroidales bacterium]MBR1755323.1 deoxynucleoside kinase [Bacteroidaceae bacterium]
MHIAIAGNIGSGKTTLTKMLAKHYRYRPMYESTEENPYLASFYEDMRRWSFNLQIYFLHSRFKQLLDIKRSSRNIVQDRTLYEDAYIFAPNLHAMGLLNSRDYENYLALFELLVSFVQPPDLLIYLRGEVPSLIRQIQRRGRDYESSIRLDYLTSLNQRYEEWVENYDKGKVLIVNIDELNFADHPEDLGTVINMIDAEFNGLFPKE